MKSFKNMVGVAVLLAGTALGSAASADASAMTCGGFAAMDDAARLNYAHELLLWIADTANVDAAGGALIGRYAGDTHDETTGQTDVLQGKPTGAWTHLEMKIEIEGHCIKRPADTNIVQVLKDHT